MKLPKLYSPVKIRFSSLRNGFGDNYGILFDIDTEVDHIAVRVACESGWKWQIKDILNMREWNYCVDTDQESLNEIGMDLDDIVLTRKKS